MYSKESKLIAHETVNSAVLAFRWPSISGDRVDSETSIRDEMLQGSEEHYMLVGSSALAAIQAVARVWRKSEFESILDFGCGHGRVLRWLRAAYPNAAVVASDISEDGIAFCAEKFAATPWLSTIDIGKLSTSTKFDLIWAGSVITHLPESSARILLSKFISWLRPGGIVVFSSHGRAALRAQLYGPIDYLMAGNRSTAISGYYRDGYGYADFPNSPGYGASFVRIDWYWRFFEGIPDVDLVGVTERAWDFHHDVVAASAFNRSNLGF